MRSGGFVESDSGERATNEQGVVLRGSRKCVRDTSRAKVRHLPTLCLIFSTFDVVYSGAISEGVLDFHAPSPSALLTNSDVATRERACTHLFIVFDTRHPNLRVGSRDVSEKCSLTLVTLPGIFRQAFVSFSGPARSSNSRRALTARLC